MFWAQKKGSREGGNSGQFFQESLLFKVEKTYLLKILNLYKKKKCLPQKLPKQQ